MGLFILRRVGVMILTALCLTFVVFFLTNLPPNLEKLAKTQGEMRMTDDEVDRWLSNRGYSQPLVVKYGQWLGVLPGFVIDGTDGQLRGKCIPLGGTAEGAPFTEADLNALMGHAREGTAALFGKQRLAVDK